MSRPSNSVVSRSALFKGLCTALLLCAGSISALAADEDWKELVVPPPTRFRLEQLIPVEEPPGSSLRYGMDPDSLSLGADGVVRYVLVARSNSGALNVLFEGIRCETGEMKTYARWNNQSAWNLSTDAAWRPLRFSGSTRHGMSLAKSGICDGNTTNGNTANMLNRLKAGTSHEH